MRQMTALMWKEWREARAFLWIGLGVFIGLPVIGGLLGLAQYSSRFEITTGVWVLPFAGVLAVFAAVGATCREFGGRLNDFWHAQPVGVFKRLLVKFGIGLAILLTVCIVPMLLEASVNKKKDRDLLTYAAWLPFLWTALYSLGFAAGCVVRRTAHAGMLGLSAMLLLYSLPIVLPPLEWLNVETVTERVSRGASSPFATSRQLKFAGGMLGISIASLALGVVAVQRRWHVESGRKMMYGAVSAAILIVFATAAFRLGTNLPILQTIDLPTDEVVASFRVEGQRGVLISRRYVPVNPDDYSRGAFRGRGAWSSYEWKSRNIDIGTTQIALGEATTSSLWSDPVRSDSGASGRSYVAGEYFDTESGKIVCYLYREGIDSSTTVRKVWEYDREGNGKWRGRRVVAYAWENHLYIIGTRLARMNLDQMGKIEMLPMTTPYTLGNRDAGWFGPDKVIIPLPPVPQLPPRQRLEAVLKSPDTALENDLLCVSRGESLLAYRLTTLTEATAIFEKTGEHKDSLLERIFGSYRYFGIKLQNGLFFVSSAPGARLFNPHVTVFDARDGQPLRPIGHFAAPGTQMLVSPLPDGRSLIVGSKLWVVGPPPVRKPG